MARDHVAARLDGLSLSLTRQLHDAAPDDAINLGLGEPTFDTDQSIVSAARGSLDAGRLPYTPNAGLPALRAAIAERAHGRFSADSVCVTVGATGALLASIFATVDQGDEVLVPDPGFPSYAAVAAIAGAQPVRYPMTSVEAFRFSCDALEPFISERTSVVVINSPSNPTGHVASRDQLERLAELADAHELTVISDETYNEIYFGERPTSYHEVSERGIVVSCLSKTESMTGWRLGWAIGPRDLARAMTVVNQYAVTCAPTLSQQAALAALASGFDARAARLRESLDRHRRLIIELVEAHLEIPFIDPQGAFFLLLEAAPHGSSLDVALDVLDKTGVITVPGAGFGHQAEHFLRLSFSATEDEIREGIRRLSAYPFERLRYPSNAPSHQGAQR